MKTIKNIFKLILTIILLIGICALIEYIASIISIKVIITGIILVGIISFIMILKY